MQSIQHTLEHVVYILVTTIVWPCWICYAYVMQLICTYIGSTGLDISSHFGQAVKRCTNTGYMDTFLFYFLEKFST